MNKPILLVEDEDHDVLFLQIALESAEARNHLAVVRDGREAIAYLKGDGEFANRQDYPLPGLVLLDLRLPRVPGLEVLKWIRQQPAFATLPILICSSSDQESDVDSAYQLGANGYLVKPSRMADRLELVRRVKRYWLDRDGPPPDCKEWEAINVRRPVPHPFNE
jgi:two-component system response regulator